MDLAPLGDNGAFLFFSAVPALLSHCLEIVKNHNAIYRADVEIRITHSGVCHSDLHTVKGEWGPFDYPVVAGHEILGFVTAKGAKVSSFSVGQCVGVGPQALSCGSCKCCANGVTTYCQKGFVGTYKADLPNGHRSMVS